MPRQRRPAFEGAVTASPLFKLALEVRIMIYELLLIQEGGMFIPSDTFARRCHGRTGSAPYICRICGLVFLSRNRCAEHYEHRHSIRRKVDLEAFWPLLPEVSIALLQTCRLIRFEASPILYSRNSFHFSDPATASNFRWGTDCTQAGATQEIVIKFGSLYFNQSQSWVTYFTKRPFGLGQEFPHLRRMTINLDAWLGIESADRLRSMCELFRNRHRELDWVLVLMLDKEKLLDCFEQLVHRGDDPANGQKEVRRHVWPVENGRPWKNGLLWWGPPGEAVPHKYRLIGDQPEEKVTSEVTNKGDSTQLTAPAT